MAVRFSAASQMLARTANLPEPDSFTATFWYFISGGGGTEAYYNMIVLLSDVGGTNYRTLYYNQNDDRIGLEWDAGEYDPLIEPVTTGWFFCAIVGDGLTTGDVRGYATPPTQRILNAGASDQAATDFTPAVLSLSVNDAGYFLNGKIAAFKMWDVGMTEAEIRKERFTYRPQKTADLHMWTPLINDFKDYGPLGRDWTETGTVTYEEGPPIGWGSLPYVVRGVGGAPPVLTYAQVIAALGADHHWDFDGDSNDQIGSVNGTDTSIIYTSAGIAEDVTNCAETNAVGDRVSMPTTANINNSAQTRKCVCGWFMATAVQRPPKRIYGEGDATTSFAFALGWGNNVIFEVDSASFTLQVYTDTFLADDRAYHLCLIFEGNGYGNELRAYLDGVEQLNAQPTDRQPDAASLAARGVAEFGDPAGTVGLGGAAIELEASVNGKYNHWVTFDGAPAVLTDSEVRVELFEKGALPDVTISSGTESAMQTALDVYADTVRGDAPLCIRVEAVSGGGDFELTLDNITFNPLASIHVQYMGSDTLTLTNTNGANCSIVSAPWGAVVVQTEVTLAVTVRDVVTNALIVGARVYIEAAGGGDLPTETEIMNTTTNGSGLASIVFDYTSDQPIIAWVRKGTTTPLYREGPLPGPITAAGLTETVLLIPDE